MDADKLYQLYLCEPWQTHPIRGKEIPAYALGFQLFHALPDLPFLGATFGPLQGDPSSSPGDAALVKRVDRFLGETKERCRFDSRVSSGWAGTCMLTAQQEPFYERRSV